MFERNKSQESTLFLSLGYQKYGSKQSHKETSGQTDFFSINQSTELDVHNVNINISKEFLSSNYFSFTLLGLIGINKGSKKDVDSSKTINYKEKADGNQLGGGLSLNLNTVGYGLKIQPYISTQYIKANTEYRLAYNKVAETKPSLNITYDDESTLLHHSLGIRFFNSETFLMSYLSLDFIQEINTDSKATGLVETTEFKVDNASNERDFSSVGLSFGVGYLF